MRLIDGDKLYDDVRDCIIVTYDEEMEIKNEILEEIERAPSFDAVLVVRCKDCRYFKMYKCRMGYSNHDDFCSYGERKDDAT